MTDRCSVCARRLTDADSKAIGMGPVCAERRGAKGMGEKKSARAGTAPRTRRARGTRAPRAKWAQLEMFSAATAAGQNTNGPGVEPRAAVPAV